MKKKYSRILLAIFVVLLILFIDQIIKIWIKTTMYYGESIRLTDWFYLYFIENSGMAFGIKIIPKVIQTLFRILFSGTIVWYIAILAKANFRRGYIVCISLILAGAIGNILDSIFYGVIFSQSTSAQIASFVPIGTGYTDWLYGKVVDMFYFPLWEFNWPQWMPYVGGENFVFFSPVFNFADASICCGVFMLFIFYMKDLNRSIPLVKVKWNALKKKSHLVS